jgi:hypothetical protein
MGIHICLYKNEEDHPEWDYIRQANDRDFPGIIDWGKVTFCNGEEDDYFRPKNIDELREKINNTDWDNKERYLKLMDLISRDADCWLYFSY